MDALEARRQILGKTEVVDRYDMSAVISVVPPTPIDEAVRTQKHALTFDGMDISDASFVRDLAAVLNWEDVPVSNQLVIKGSLSSIVSLHPERSKDAVRVLTVSDTSLSSELPKSYPKAEDVTVYDSGEGKSMSLVPLNGWALLKRLSVHSAPSRGISFDGFDSTIETLYVNGRVLGFPKGLTSSLVWTEARDEATVLCSYLESRKTPLARLDVSSAAIGGKPMPMRRLLSSHATSDFIWRDAVKSASVSVDLAFDEKKKLSIAPIGTTPYRLLHLFSHSASVAFLSSRIYEQLKLGSIESFGICTPLYSTLKVLQLLNGQLVPWRMLWDHVLNESNQSLRTLWIEVPQGSHLDDTFLYLKMLLDMVLAYLSRVPKSQHPMQLTVNLKPHTAPTEPAVWTEFTDRLMKMYTARAGIPARTRMDALLQKDVPIAQVKVELDWMQLHCDSKKAIADVARAIETITDATRKEVLYPLRQHASWFNYTILTSTSIRANVSLHTLAIVVHA